MYDTDSFFTLSLVGRIGLLAVSLTMAITWVWLFLRLTRRVLISIQFVIALVFLWFFVWLSPQLYYLYYLLLFEGLTLQNVVSQPPSAADILTLLLFIDGANFSNHGKGVLGWVLLLSVVLRNHEWAVKLRG